MTKIPAKAADHAASIKAPANATDQVTSTAGTSLKSMRFDRGETALILVTSVELATLDRHQIFE
ncbi:hypothetical protein [Paenarthrobacter nitroguajacolicus]|uniref:hypothetical protein n=1 Tax=Paenarthrobacter nitroguajacolicus TaxID=211146 RepID=UPI001FBAA992|nr:hypothetical protein [Paenarthrobacter nitroguajacolicus]